MKSSRDLVKLGSEKIESLSILIGLYCDVSDQITLYYKMKKMGSYASYTVMYTL